MFDDEFDRHVALLEDCLDRGDLERAESICSSQLGNAKNALLRAEWLRRHAEVLVEFGCFRRGKDMASRAVDEISNTAGIGGAPESIIDFTRLSTLEFGSRIVDPPLATDLAREVVVLGSRLLESASFDQKSLTDVWLSLANAYGVLGMPGDRLRCYLSAAKSASFDTGKQILIWLGVADAKYETDGFECSYQVIQNHILPEMDEFPELVSLVFLQLGDLFLDNEQWRSACMAYEVARDGLKDDPIRRQNRPFVADLYYKLALALTNLGDSRGSIRAGETALDIVDPDTPAYVKYGAHLILGNAMAQEGHQEEALSHYQVVMASVDASDSDRQAALDGIESLGAIGRIH